MVEQRAFHLGPRDLRVFPGDAVAHRALERFQVVEALTLGQIVVEHHRLGLPHLLHLDREVGGFARQIGIRVAFRELGLDIHFGARLDAGQLLLEPGQHETGAEDQRDVFGLAALEHRAVDTPLEVDDHAIAGLARARLGRRFVLLEALGEAVERAGDRLLADLGDQAGQLDLLEIDLGHLRQHLERHGELEIGALVERGHLDLGP